MLVTMLLVTCLLVNQNFNKCTSSPNQLSPIFAPIMIIEQLKELQDRADVLRRHL